MTSPTVAQTIARAAACLSAAGIDDALLEAEVLLAHVVRIDRTRLLARLQEPLSAGEIKSFDDVLSRRLAREPLAYITAHREFFGLDMICAPGALIPRPETELLVEIALGEIQRRGPNIRIVDVGTGTGAIAVAIAAGAQASRVLAVDASGQALALARHNADRHGVADRVECRPGDLLDGLGEFDLVVANLPYVREDDWPSLAPEIRQWEPKEALVAGARGTEMIERLLGQGPRHMAPGGHLDAE
ncbi:MAG: peptide chain release factor N(5)-glutamine methyltransferase, partial [Chloroflexi bacterium]|nr:peptide chain release factor N(5)-glutamine methyltransferase [Chloroflexota bacterium]